MIALLFSLGSCWNIHSSFTKLSQKIVLLKNRNAMIKFFKHKITQFDLLMIFGAACLQGYSLYLYTEKTQYFKVGKYWKNHMGYLIPIQDNPIVNTVFLHLIGTLIFPISLVLQYVFLDNAFTKNTHGCYVSIDHKLVGYIAIIGWVMICIGGLIMTINGYYKSYPEYSIILTCAFMIFMFIAYEMITNVKKQAYHLHVAYAVFLYKMQYWAFISECSFFIIPRLIDVGPYFVGFAAYSTGLAIFYEFRKLSI